MKHLAFETLVDWWTGDLPEADLDAAELHLMGCSRCSAEAERVGAVVAALRATTPFVGREGLVALRALGLRIEENSFRPGVRQVAVFRPDLDLMVHHLVGLDLADVVSVGVTVESESSGAVVNDVPDVPFDRDNGEILVACQQHFRVFPHDIVFRVKARSASGGEREAVFLVPHRFGP